MFFLPIVFSLMLETGYMPNYGMRLGEVEYAHDLFYQTIGLKASLDFLYVEQITNVRAKKGSSIYFAPQSTDYYIGAGVKLSGFTAGVEHLCIHPNISINIKEKTLDYEPLFGGYTKVFLRYEIQFGEQPRYEE